VTVFPGVISSVPPKQDFQFSVTVSPQPPINTKAFLEISAAGNNDYSEFMGVPFSSPGQTSKSFPRSLPCGKHVKVRVRLEVPGTSPQYSDGFQFITVSCSGESGQQLGVNQKVIPVSNGGYFLVTADLSPSNNSSTTLFITGDVQNKTNPQKQISRVGLEIKKSSSATFNDLGNAGNTTQGSGVKFSKLYQQLEPNTTYNVRIWVKVDETKSYTEAFSFQTKNSGGTGGQTSNLVLVTMRPQGISSQENTTLLFTAQIPGVFDRYKNDTISFGVETESEGVWKNVHTETFKIQTGPNILSDKIITSKNENGWGFLCESTHKVRGFFSLQVNDSDPQPTKFLSPELSITTKECGSAVENSGGGNETTGDNTYTFLTPLPFNEGLKSQKSVVIGATEGGGVFGILQRIFTLMLVAAVVLAVVFMIIGGARYATGDTLGGKMSGRQIITNAITGLLFALLSWLLLNIINPDLLRLSLVIPNVGKLNTGTGTGIVNGGNDGTISGNGCGANVSDEECFEMIMEDEQNKRDDLAGENITINKEPCSSYGAPNCTNVGLLNDSTLAKLVEVKNDCVSTNQNCAVMITGGTEYWKHDENGDHRNFTAVDLRLTGADIFNQFIRSKQSVGSSQYCNSRFDYKGLRFCDEKGGVAHWHVAPTSGGGSSNNTGNPSLFTFPHINIQGYVVPGTGEVYSGTKLASKLESPAMRALETKIRTVATREGIDFKLFYSLIAQESAGNPQAVSNAGACGVAQLKPSAASEVDSTLTGDICTKLKSDVDLSISLGAKYFKKYGSTNKEKLAHYNGRDQALQASVDCPGRKKYECPWDVPGYYDRSNPSGAPLKALENQSDINTGFSETRFYVINILNMAAAMR